MTTVLLAGAAGKVGKHTVSALRAHGMRVVATDLISDGLPADVQFEACDLTNSEGMQRLVAKARPDVVAHCAAVVAPISYAEPELCGLRSGLPGRSDIHCTSEDGWSGSVLPKRRSLPVPFAGSLGACGFWCTALETSAASTPVF